jgi:hypothetical protein
MRVSEADERRDRRLAARPIGQLYVIGGHHGARRVSKLERAAQLDPALKRERGMWTHRTRPRKRHVSECAARGAYKILQGSIAWQWSH